MLPYLLQACGGGDNDSTPDDEGGNTTTSLDYSGETKQAELTSQNVDEIASGAASGTKQVINSGNVPIVPVVGQQTRSPVSREQIRDDLSMLIVDAVQGGNDQLFTICRDF